MTLFITNTVGFLIWLVVIVILVPIVISCLLISILAGFHAVSYCERWISSTYNNAVEKLGGKFSHDH